VEGSEEPVAETVGDPEPEEEDVPEFVVDEEDVVLADDVPVRLWVAVAEFVVDTVAVCVEVVVPEVVAVTVAVLVVVTEAVPECVADMEAVSLCEGVPVRLTVEDPVLVLETEVDAVGVEAADAEVVADVVFVAECVSGPRVSVAVEVCDAETETERLEIGVADHVLDAVAVADATAEVVPETVEVLETVIERDPVGEIVLLLEVEIERDPVVLTVCERVPLGEGEDDPDPVAFGEGVPEIVGFVVVEPDAEMEDDREDVLDAVFVGDPDDVLEPEPVAETDRVTVPEAV
jgi:hypothetical protein